MSIFEDQADFMRAGGQLVGEYNNQQSNLYIGLIQEEYTEFMDAIVDNAPKEEKVKECVDVLVVAIGWLHSQGIDPQAAWNLVHENNMMKTGDDIKYDSNGKIMKSPESKVRKSEMMKQLKALCDGGTS